MYEGRYTGICAPHHCGVNLVLVSTFYSVFHSRNTIPSLEVNNNHLYVFQLLTEALSRGSKSTTWLPNGMSMKDFLHFA